MIFKSHTQSSTTYGFLKNERCRRWRRGRRWRQLGWINSSLPKLQYTASLALLQTAECHTREQVSSCHDSNLRHMQRIHTQRVSFPRTSPHLLTLGMPHGLGDRRLTGASPNTAQNVNVNNNPPAPPPNPPPRSPPPGSSSSSDDSDSDFVYDNTRRRVRRRHPHSDPDDSGDSVFGDDTRNLGLRQLTQYMADSDFFDGDVSRVPEESDWILTGMGVVLYFIGWASILTLFAVIVVF